MDFTAKLNRILKIQEMARLCNMTATILPLPWYPIFTHIIPSKLIICLMHGICIVFIFYDLVVTFQLSSYCQCCIHLTSAPSAIKLQLLWLPAGRYLHSFYEYLHQVPRKRNHLKSQCCPLVAENILMLHRWSAFNARMFPWVGKDEEWYPCQAW